MKEKRKTKQILCQGLAFCGEEEMEMLHAYALDGWIFRKFSGLSYVLYKEEPQDLIFSYDLNKVKKEDAQEYLDLFAAAGWEQITCNSSSTWFFMAKQGTPPLHSDHATLSEEYTGIGKTAKYLLLVLAFVSLFSFFLIKQAAIFMYLFAFGCGCIGGLLMLLIGTQFRKHKRKLCITMWSFQRSMCYCLGSLFIMLSMPFLSDIVPSLHILWRFLRLGAWMLFIATLFSMYWRYPLYRDHKEQYLFKK